MTTGIVKGIISNLVQVEVSGPVPKMRYATLFRVE
jgi:hypothetical protein